VPFPPKCRAPCLFCGSCITENKTGLCTVCLPRGKRMRCACGALAPIRKSGLCPGCWLRPCARCGKPGPVDRCCARCAAPPAKPEARLARHQIVSAPRILKNPLEGLCKGCLREKATLGGKWCERCFCQKIERARGGKGTKVHLSDAGDLTKCGRRAAGLTSELSFASADGRCRTCFLRWKRERRRADLTARR
jgi:hypothetical protein